MKDGVHQRLYPTLRVGFAPTATGKRGQPVRVHARQGEWDGACGLYCAAMALTILGKITGATRLPDRKYGAAGALWSGGQSNYFEGLDGYELTCLLQGVDPELFVRWRQGTHSEVLRIAKAQLDAERLPILAWSSRSGGVHHWVLAVGIETVQKSGKPYASAILCLDPSRPEPVLTAYNGRIELLDNPRSYGPEFVRYVTNQGDTAAVTLTELVAVGNNRDS
jgi:hypothetical protein